MSARSRPGRLLRWTDRLSPAAVVLVSVAVPALLRILLLPILPIPGPAVEDEFSYLLAADTFTHGRMANPPLPLGVFFESFHVLVRPTYASMYQPGQGAFLAIGQALFGHPWWGVFLSSALMNGAITWLLLAWAPRRWALAGGLSFGLLFGLESYWINSYWGGAVPAFGGALAVGAVSRICLPGRNASGPLKSGVLLGLGGALLLFTRPWEGACLGAALVIAALWWNVWRGSRETRRAILSAAVPAACILGAAGLLLLRYDQRVTGDPWLPPYLLDLRTYYVAPLFLWQDEKPSPEYPTEIMRRFYTGWRESEGSLRKAQGTRSPIVGLAMWIWDFKLVAGSVAAALVAALLLRDPRTRWLLALFGLVLAALSVQSVRQLHYLAPAAGLFVAVQVTGLRALGTLKAGRRRLLRHLPAVVLLAAAIGSGRNVVLARISAPWGLHERRARLVARLNAEPGRHLVLVRYGPEHSVHEEWVYNGADVDEGAVVFAHERSPDENALLLAHFSGRRAWLLAPDDGDRLTPLSRPERAPPSRH